MNTYKIINLGKATTNGEALEYSQLQEKVDDITTIYNQAVTAKNQAQAAQQAAELAESGAEAAEDQAEAILAQVQSLYDSYNNQYLGTFASPPTVDNKGNPLTVGDLYYDSISLAFRVWDGTQWQDVASMTPTSNDVVSNKIYVNAVFRGNIVPETDDGSAIGTTLLKWSDLFLASGAVINFNNSNVAITHAANRLNVTGISNGMYFSNTIAPTANDGAALGSGSVSWSDLFLASGAVINFANSDVTITHATDSLLLAGASNGYNMDNALKFSGGYGTVNGSGHLAIGSGTTSPNRASFAWGDGSGWFLNLGTNISSTFTPRYQFSDDGVFRPATSDGAVLGDSTHLWSDLFLASGAVINFNNNLTLTHSSGTLTTNGTFAAQRLNLSTNFSLYDLSSTLPILLWDGSPADYMAYDRTNNIWSYYVNSSSVFQVRPTLIAPGVNDSSALGANTVAWSDLFLASGAVINFNNGNVVLTHGSGTLNVSTGTLQQGGSNVLKATDISSTVQPYVASTNTDAITYVIDSGGAGIATGVWGDLMIPFNCTISKWTLLADQSGSIVVDVWKNPYSSYPAAVGQKITASAPPTISVSNKGQSSTLTGWTTTISAGDTLRFNVNSVTSILRVTLVLTVTKT